jgi:hypothetical protein
MRPPSRPIPGVGRQSQARTSVAALAHIRKCLARCSQLPKLLFSLGMLPAESDPSYELLDVMLDGLFIGHVTAEDARRVSSEPVLPLRLGGALAQPPGLGGDCAGVDGANAAGAQDGGRPPRAANLGDWLRPRCSWGPIPRYGSPRQEGEAGGVSADSTGTDCDGRVGGVFIPGLYLFSGPARLMRPVYNLRTQREELIGSFEQVCGAAQLFAALPPPPPPPPSRGHGGG